MIRLYAVVRPRRYVSENRLALLKPFFRYSAFRDAYVLRAAHGTVGPVLRVDRRRSHRHEAIRFDGADRRRERVA